MHSSTPNGRKKTSSPTAKTGDQVEVQVVADERIHPYTCHVISHLFPPHTRGQTFMFGLLSNAVFKCNALTDLPADDRRGVAIVRLTHGCAELSQRVDLGYDTTQMYLAIYRTLGLLYYVKQGEYTTISIPLDAYRPPSDLMERLYQLRERYRQKRPRMRRLVDNIIERIAPFLQEEPEQFAYSAELLHRVRYVLATQGVADPKGLIAQHIVTEIATFVTVAADNNVSQEIRTTAPFTPRESTPTSIPTKCKVGRYGQNVPDISPGQNTGKRAGSSVGDQDQVVEKERFVEENLPSGGTLEERASPPSCASAPSSTRYGRFQAPSSSSCQHTETKKVQLLPGPGRFGGKNLPTNQYEGKRYQASSNPTRQNLPDTVDSRKHIQFNGNGIGNRDYSDITQSTPDPDPVETASILDDTLSASPIAPLLTHPSMRQQARSLALLIEGNEENVGAYIALCKAHEPQTLRAAVIATLLRKHFPGGQGALKKPGGYFTRRVQQFRHTLPEQILVLAEAYAKASYEEIDVALGAQAHEHTQQQLAGPVQNRDMSLPWRGEPMDRVAAEALSRRIAQEDTYVQVAGTCRMPGDRYAVKVFIGQLEHCFCSAEDWVDYHTEMQTIDQEEIA
jgi:hypothetical protein